ncbi:hypothetical protein QJS10_CPA02g00765 [Acorus calamus]|uniref:Uncharacterized protein n=1 Tax=Acorus calamus TaxID=4465 RepID=A0AAV9FCU2_ACOCL|nr:hypothetical protein QJS10_CPA02g00765 [Acorus calamus]
MPPNHTSFALSATSLLRHLLFTAADALSSTSTSPLSTAPTPSAASPPANPPKISPAPQPGSPILLAVPFDSLSGGRNYFCGVKFGGLSLLCSNTTDPIFAYPPKRIYTAKPFETV